MSRRHIFTERQRAALFDLPTDELSLLKFYTLGDDDLENIRQRRRPENRIGFALQLSSACARMLWSPLSGGLKRGLRKI